MPWRSEGWQGEQAGRFPGDAGAGLPTSWERKGPSVWPQRRQRAAGQRLQEGPLQCGPKGVTGPRVRGSSKERVVVTQLTQETGAPCWRDPGTALWKRGHVHGATLNTLLL